MTEEQEDVVDVASEQPNVDTAQPQEDNRMVPLAALEAERKKRQEMEAKASLYEQYLLKAKADEAAREPEEDPSALVEKGFYSQDKQMTKREILEEVYQDMNPEAVKQINLYLKPILEKKPWLSDSLDKARNRYARAYEIVNDYMHLVQPPAKPSTGVSDAQRIVQNSQKPRSPVEIGKSAQPGGKEFLKSIQGKSEFREYRQKVLRGEA